VARLLLFAWLSLMGTVCRAVDAPSTHATELYEGCAHLEVALKGAAIDPQHMQLAGICMGFIEAGFDGVTLGSIAGAQAFGDRSITGPEAAYDAMRRARVRYACVPLNVPNRERLAIFMRYFERNEASIRARPPTEGSAVVVIVASLAEAYPCR
jgi:hypothetical protein